jgi:hypothetical protein
MYEEKRKQTLQTKLNMFLIKKISSTPTQEHDLDVYCTVSLSKDEKITAFKMKNNR